MPKYYRVRTQEQWDWLMQWFEKQDKNIRWGVTFQLPTKFNAYDSYLSKTVIDKNDEEEISYSGLDYFQQDEGVTDFIEVSQMMEESKMEDYVTISRDDLFQIEDQDGEGIVQVDGKGEFSIPDMPIDEISIPKSLLYPKVRISVAEKKEFDRLKENALTLRFAFDELKSEHGNYPKLCERLFNNTLHVEDSKAQNDFARAWADPSLIEAIPKKKWNVKIFNSDDSIYWKKQEGGLTATVIEDSGNPYTRFTAEELKHYGLDNDLFEKVEVSE